MAKPPLLLTNRPKAVHAVNEKPMAGVPTVALKSMKKNGILKRRPKPGANPTRPDGAI